ncbi:MAG: argininosuccinate lyase [Spirochaetales bacterium]|nr:argininosuccinate lyase [Spirochaetales bacterium]
MAKLWQKNYELNTLIEGFTVGKDYLLDQALVPADCAASLAHGKMLEKIGILTNKELESLEKGFHTIVDEHARGVFTINRSDEDCHTAIENRLTELAGDAGKKIHTGRSRNDQVQAATRLFGRRAILDVLTDGISLVSVLLKFAEANKAVPMPGRTHMQIAMPSSVGLWAGAWAEEIFDGLLNLNNVYDIFNQSPLGAAASYGVPLPLDREMTADLMGYKKVQNNVLYVNNSRGKLESMVLSALDYMGITLSCMAQDLILFSLPEFGYFSLPRELCSGSSIMPQKKNPDGLELMRAKAATLSSLVFQVRGINRALPSGYNRDFQETKEPFLKGLSLAGECLKVMDLTFEKLEVNQVNLEKGFTSDIYATDAALELVAAGSSFRDAYKEVGLNLDKLADRNPADSVKNRTHTGTAGNPGFEICGKQLEILASVVAGEIDGFDSVLSSLMGKKLDLIAGLARI